MRKCLWGVRFPVEFLAGHQSPTLHERTVDLQRRVDNEILVGRFQDLLYSPVTGDFEQYQRGGPLADILGLTMRALRGRPGDNHA